MATNEKVEINVENGITTMVHEMKMNGCHLVDRKQRTSMCDVHSQNPRIDLGERFLPSPNTTTA